MQKTDKTLKTLYVATIAVVALIAIYFEFINPDHVGCLFDEQNRIVRTVFEDLTVFVSLLCCYGMLKIMTMKRVKAAISSEKGYKRWAIVRWCMMNTSVLLCELVYYLFLSSNVLPFMAISGITLLFVWPTEARRKMDMNVETKAETIHLEKTEA